MSSEIERDREHIIKLVKSLVSKRVIGTFSWKTFTSIFIGIVPRNLEVNGNSVDQKGPFFTVVVHNTVEKRDQEEKIRKDKSLGIVLRGQQLFGWTSQPYLLEAREGVFAYGVPLEINISSSITKKELKIALNSLIQELIIAVKNKSSNSNLEPNYTKGHIAQLNKLANELNDSFVFEQFMSIIKQSKGAVQNFTLIARTYGGNVDRYGCTFETLRNNFDVNIIPENFGDNYTEYSYKNKTMIVGYEIQNGKTSYIRLKRSDLPRKLTFF